MNRPETEMAYWRRQYEENYESAYCTSGNAFAITAPHKFITRRMEKMADALQHIERLGGKQAVRSLLIGKEGGDKIDDG